MSLFYRTEIVLTAAGFIVGFIMGGDNMRRAILQALEDKYNADISHADATIKIYLNNSVGIGEHPQHIEEIDKLIEKIANAQEKLEVLKQFEPEKTVL